MAKIRIDNQIESALASGYKVIGKKEGETDWTGQDPKQVSPTTWIADDAGIYENTPGQFEIPSLPYAKDVDTVITRGGKVYKYNSTGGYFELVFDFVINVIVATEPDIAQFAANSGNYNFKSGDTIAIDDGLGSYNLFLYNGGTKTDTNSYLPLNASQTEWSQVINTPTTLAGYGITDAATSAQGSLADTALQPGSNISELNNDENYIDASGAPIQSVTGSAVDNTDPANPVINVGVGGVQSVTGDGVDNVDPENPVLSFPDADEVDDTTTTNKFVTAAEKADIASALQAGDNISQLNNDSGFVDSAGASAAAPVQSVNSQSGAVVLDADDIDDTATVNKFVTQALINTLNSAVQPGDLAPVATSGDYDDLLNKPPIPDSLDDLSGNSDDVTEGTTNLFMTTTERNKLSGIASGAEVNVNADWNAASGDAEILNKPTLGTAASADTGDFATAAQGNLADSSVQSVTGAGVDNTDPKNPIITISPNGVQSVDGGTGIDVDSTDPENPQINLNTASISSLQKADTAIQPGDLATVATSGEFGDLQNIPDFVEESERDQPGGFAGVGMDGFIPSLLLPSYVDDVLEFADFSSLPATGESGKIYITLDDNLTYRWGGSAYVEISASLALGETSSTAYRGDRGKTAYDHSQVTSGNPHNVTSSDVGLGNVDNTSDTDKPVSTAQGQAINQAEADAKLYTDQEITALNLGSASQSGVGDFATSTQGSKADSAVQPGDIDTLAELNSIITDANLDDESSPRPPTAHTHTASEITDFDTEVSNNSDVSQNTTDRHTHANKTALDNVDNTGAGNLFLSDDGTYKGVSTGSADWGAIIGTLSNQIDLQNALDGKSNVGHQHTASDITDFDTEVGNNADVTANTSARHTHANKTDLDNYDPSNFATAAQGAKADTALQTESDPTVPVHVKNITSQNITDWNNADPNPTDTDEVPEGATNKYYTETRVSSNSDVAANTAARHTHSNKALLDAYNQTNADITQAISDASTAVQPGDLAPVATSGDYEDLTNKPAIPNNLDDLSGTSDDITEGATQLFFTLTERNKLSGITPGAEVNVNADWNAVSGDAEILNKPTLGTAAAADTGDFATSAQGALADSALQTESDPTVPAHVKNITSQNIADWNASDPNPTDTDEVPEGTTNKYYTETRVSSNSDVAANTSSRHSHANKALLDTYTQTDADIAQAISDANTAVQPGDLSTVATSGDYNDLTNKPTIPDSLDDLSGNSDDITEGSTQLFFTLTERNKLSGIDAGAEANVNADWNAASGDTQILNKPTLGTAAAADTGDFATSVQGALADTAVQPGDNISDLNNDSAFVDATGAANAAPVQSVNGQTGAVSLDSGDVGAIPMTQKGVNGGVAELDVNGYVPSSQLPSFVDDVIEVANFASLPGTGESGKIYITIDDNLTYRWGGSAYVLISPSLALGETSSTAYRGDRGKIAYDHSQLTSGNPHNVTKTNVGLGNVDNTSDVNKPISTAVQNALNGKFDQPSGTTAQYIRGNGTLATFPTIPNSLDDLSGDSDDIQEGSTNLFLTTTERNKLSGIASGAEVNVNSDWNAVSGDSEILNKPTLGTASAADVGDFATSVQGSKADSAVQPGDLATVATTGAYSDLSGTPTLGTAAAADTGDFATAMQGALADTAVQPGDLATVATTGAYSDLTGAPAIPNSLGDLSGDSDDISEGTTNLFMTSSERSKLTGIASGAEVNVNADWNAVSGDAQILNKPTLGTAAAADTGDFATAAQGSLANTAIQSSEKGAANGVSTLNANQQLTESQIPDIDFLDPVEVDIASFAANSGSYTFKTGDYIRLIAGDLALLYTYIGGLKTDVNSYDVVFVNATPWSVVSGTPTTLSGYGITDAATSAQGALADTATQPGDLATVATSGNYNDLTNKPTIPDSLDDLSGTSDDITEGTSQLFFTLTERNKLSGIEANADVTDATNVKSAGATMNTDTDISVNDWVLDEDDMLSDSDTKVPTQQSVKAYVDANAGGDPVNLFTDDLTLTEDRTHNFEGYKIQYDGDIDSDISYVFMTDEGRITYFISGYGVGLQVYNTAWQGQAGFTASTNSNDPILRIQTGQNPNNVINQYLRLIDNTGVVEYSQLEIPEYASDTDADNDSDLASGAPYSVAGDRVVKTKSSASPFNPSYGYQTLTDAANISWDMDLGEMAEVTLGNNRTLDNPTNLKKGTYSLLVKQDANGGRTLDYGTAFKWPDGAPPDLTSDPNSVDLLTFVSDGTNIYGAITSNYS